MAKKRRQQPLARPPLITRIRAYFRDHVRSIFFSLGKLYRQPFASVLTILMIAIALALPACLYVVLNNIQNISSGWEDAGQISVFLKLNTSEQQATELKKEFSKLDGVESVTFISAAQALNEFKQRSEFGGLLDGLDTNPLPPTFVITPTADSKETDALNQLTTALQKNNRVDHVQLDMQWLQRLQAILKITKRTVIIIAVMLCLSVLLVVGNSIRLDIENRRSEIEVTKLIGGTNAFIQRPFLYGGTWYGLLGGLLALFFVITVLGILKQPVLELTTLYSSNFKLQFPSFGESISLLLLSVGLGLFGAWLAVSRRISKIEPS